MDEIISGNLGRETTTETVVNAPVKKAVDTSMFGALESGVKLVAGIGKGTKEGEEDAAVANFGSQLSELAVKYEIDSNPSVENMQGFNVAATKLSRATTLANAGKPGVLDKIAKTYEYVVGGDFKSGSLSQSQKEFNRMQKEIEKLPAIQRTGDFERDSMIVKSNEKETFELENMNKNINKLKASNQWTEEQKKYSVTKATDTLFSGVVDIYRNGISAVVSAGDPVRLQEVIGVLRDNSNAYIASKITSVPPAIAADVAKELKGKIDSMINLVSDTSFSAEQKQKVLNSMKVNEDIAFHMENPGAFKLGLEADMSQNQMTILMNNLGERTLPKDKKGAQAIIDNPDTIVKVTTKTGQQEASALSLTVNAFINEPDINSLVNISSLKKRNTSENSILDEVAKTPEGLARIKQVNEYLASELSKVFPVKEGQSIGFATLEVNKLMAPINNRYINQNDIASLGKAPLPEQVTLINAYNNTLKVLKANSKSK